jgi:hypothetical protein
LDFGGSEKHDIRAPLSIKIPFSKACPEGETRGELTFESRLLDYAVVLRN